MAKKGVDCSEIIENFLYLGNSTTSKNFEYLQSIGITHIINLAGKTHFPNQFKYFKCHFKVTKYDKNNKQFIDKLEAISQFIDNCKNKNDTKQRNKIFIHCTAGISRSPSIVIGYLMKIFNLALIESYIYVKTIRSGIQPNINFFKQLSTLKHSNNSHVSNFGANNAMVVNNVETEIINRFRIK